jgi:hypothetical protein
MEARGVDGDPARGAAKQERDRAEDKFTVGSHDKNSETTRYCVSDYFSRLKLTLAKPSKLAERGGFEPPVGFYTYGALAKRCFRPLSHLSEAVR